jgi:outer membrane protein assembly factor BamD (BamD/ComL family)
MSQAYTKLDMPELAKDAERVLAMNTDSGAIVDDPLKLRDENLVENFWTLIGLDEN